VNRMKAVWERLRSGLVLLGLCAALWAPLTGAALLGLRLDWNRWVIAVVGAAVMLAEAYFIGAYLHEDELPALPLPDGDDCDEWGPYGAGRQA